MIKVTSITKIALFSGLVAVTEQQYKGRKHCLGAIEREPGDFEELDEEFGIFEITSPIELKQGETFYLEEIPKSLEQSLEFDSEPEETEPKKGNKVKGNKGATKKDEKK